MACEVVTSPFSDHALDESWMKTAESGNGFDALVNFNATFGGNCDSTIDPQMLSNPPSPANSFNTDFDAASGLGVDPQGFANTQAPYYSIEQHNGSQPLPASSRLRHEFRRSVSEPPDGLPLHHRHVQSEPQMSFNRNGHFIGHTQPPELQSIKSLPKGKQMRSQPYKTKMNGRMPQPQRYQLRRTQTQPVRQYAPTSTPSIPPPSHPYPPALAQGPPPGHHISQQMFEPLPAVPEQRSYISSRVCTPTPEEVQPPFAASPQQVIDPLLTAPPTPAVGLVDGQGQAVTMPLTVEELRSMIMEAVQKAVQGLGSGKANEEDTGTDAGLEKPAEVTLPTLEQEQANGEQSNNEPRSGDNDGAAPTVKEEEDPDAHDGAHDDMADLFGA